MQDKAFSESSKQKTRRGPRFSLASGDRPLEGYTIKRGVGVGGFGEVYYATSDAGKEVALKRIQRNLEIELRGVRHCLNLKHVNLVALYDIKYDKDDQAWVVMEYVSGESLQDVIERNPNGMSLDEIKKWFGGIAAGVAHLHDCGIVHRDLKPGNIFIDDVTVKIGDYGLSKFISCSRRSGQTQSVGTFHYMAPEIGQGTYGKEIDIYALGIILYEMVTGRVPFDGESSQEIIMKHLTAEPSLDGIQSPFREVISQALAKDPAQRCSSAALMMERIAGIVSPGDVVRNAAATAKSAGDVAGKYVKAASVKAPQVATAATAAAVAAGAALRDVRQHAVSSKVPPEPIARIVSNLYQDLITFHQNLTVEMTRPQANFAQGAMIVGYAFLLLSTSKAWGPVVIPMVVLYGFYYLGRWVLYSLFGTNRPHDEPIMATQVASLVSNEVDQQAHNVPILAEPVPVGADNRRGHRRAKPAKQKRLSRKSRNLMVTEQQRLLRGSLRGKPARNHLKELTGSYLLSAMVCIVVGLLGLMVAGIVNEGSPVSWVGDFTWVTMTSITAAWAILFTSKWWESSKGDAILRRFVMFAIGLAVGLAAYGMAGGLGVEPPYIMPFNDDFGLAHDSLPNGLYNIEGSPHLLGYLAFFGCLFAVLRWWKQADPIRSSRVGIWRTAFVLLAAVFVQAFFPFPCGFAIAAATALSVQMAAPFVDQEERQMICKAGTTDGGVA